MPYSNEHAARINKPSKYVRFRRENNKFGSGIDAIWGITKDGTVELQAIRFDKSKFTPEEAQKWCADHDHKPISFEPAQEKKSFLVPEPERGVRREMLCSTPKLECGKTDSPSGPGTLEGYAAAWNNVDHADEIIRPGSCLKTIQERVPTGKVKVMTRHICYGGDVMETAGTVRQGREDSYGLSFLGDFSSVAHAQTLRTLIREGHINACSIGYIPIKWEYEASPEGNGKTILVHKELKWLEVTPTVIPANENAILLGAKTLSLGEGTKEVLQHLLQVVPDAGALDAEAKSRALQEIGGEEGAEGALEMLEHLRSRLAVILHPNAEPDATDAKTALLRIHSGLMLREVERIQREIDLVLLG